MSQKPLDVIICFNDYHEALFNDHHEALFNDHHEALFNDHHEALFNALLLAINRSQGNKIPWRYKVLNFCI